MEKLIKLNILILMITGVFACQSQANHVRSEVNRTCENIQLPDSAKLKSGEVIQHKSEAYVLGERYINLSTHAYHLSDCGKMTFCALKWTEYERDCEAEQRTLFYFFTGYRKKCSIPKPNCD